MSRQLSRVAVVLLVQQPSPSVFNMKYFAKNGLFDNRAVEHQLNLPPLSQFVFDDGLVFEAVDQRVKIEVPLNLQTTENSNCFDGFVEDAQRLLSAIDYMEPYAMGLNFHFSYGNAATLQAFAEPVPEGTTVQGVVASKEMNGFRLTNHFRMEDTGQGQHGPALLVDTNAHFEAPVTEGGQRSLAPLLESLQKMGAIYDICVGELNHVRL